MFSSLRSVTLRYTRSLIKNIVLQIVSLFLLLSLVSIGYAAYTSLTVGEVATWQIVTQSLMTKIKDNFDDLNSRIGKLTFSNTVITATLWSQVITNSCYSTPTTLTVTTPGMYGIQLTASAYLYSGNYNNLQVQFLAPGWWLVCGWTASLPLGTANWYMIPSASCIEHLGSGIHTFQTAWSDAGNCAISTLNTLFGGTAKIRLLQAD